MRKCRRVHHKKEIYDVFVARPSKWGNPFSCKENTSAKYKSNTRMESIISYKDWILNGDGKHLLKDLPELSGKILGCWCDNGKPCHADILVELVNNLERPNLNHIF